MGFLLSLRLKEVCSVPAEKGGLNHTYGVKGQGSCVKIFQTLILRCFTGIIGHITSNIWFKPPWVVLSILFS